MSWGDYEAYDAVGLAGLVAAGETTPAELLAAALARAEALNPRLDALVHLLPDVARRLIADGSAGRAAARRAVPAQGPRRRGDRLPGEQRLAAAGGHPLRARFRALSAPQARRPRDLRAHHLARGRHRPGDRGRGLWRADPQPVGSRPHLRRLVGRRRGRGRRRHRAGRAGLGWRRLDPHPGLLLRPVRHEADARAPARRTLCRRRLGGHGDRRLSDPQRARHGGAARRHRRRRPRRALLGAAARGLAAGGDDPAAAAPADRVHHHLARPAQAIDPECRAAVESAAALLADLGHERRGGGAGGRRDGDDAGLDPDRRLRHRPLGAAHGCAPAAGRSRTASSSRSRAAPARSRRGSRAPTIWPRSRPSTPSAATSRASSRATTRC